MAGKPKKKGPNLKFKFEPEPEVILPPRDLDSRTTITLKGEVIEVRVEDLELLVELGKGAFGHVDKMRHRPSNTIMAVKRIRNTVDTREQRCLLTDLDVSMRSGDCPFTVHFYGAMFRDGDVWMCMEVMEMSLDKFYPKIFQADRIFPEVHLGRICWCVVRALEYLHSELHVIHRDVKPSNILIDRQGRVKMCDFGISGYLVNSVAKTVQLGCKPYMAPERIDPQKVPTGYDIRSDVWSLGISIVELATGTFPYATAWKTPFDQLKQVVQGDPPRLHEGGRHEFSKKFRDFIAKVLMKQVSVRPSHQQLLLHPFVAAHAQLPDSLFADFIATVLGPVPNANTEETLAKNGPQ